MRKKIDFLKIVKGFFPLKKTVINNGHCQINRQSGVNNPIQCNDTID